MKVELTGFTQALWLTHSILFTVLFGYLHQGGLLPALFALNGQLHDPSTATRNVDIVLWRTFMPPRHLLLPTCDGELPFDPSRYVSRLTPASVPQRRPSFPQSR